LAEVEVPDAAEGDTDDLLADLAAAAPEDVTETDATADVLDGLAEAEVPDAVEDNTDDLLAGLAADAPEDLAEIDATGDILDELAEVEVPDAVEEDTDDLLADLVADAPDEVVETNITADVSDDATVGLGDSSGGDLTDLLGDIGSDVDGDLDALSSDSSDGDDSDLDDLLGDLGGDDDGEPDALSSDSSDGDDSDLDDLLGDLGDGDSDLDDLLGDLGTDDTDLASESTDKTGAEMTDEPEFAYGQMSADRPEPERLNRKRFRLAILGDFSGRAARGQLETGDALAARKPILLDPDTVEDVIEGFATDLVLPIGKDGAGVAVKLGGLDDLHPDELYENVELFAELVGLRGQLANGATAENAARQLRDWGEKYGTPVAPTRSRSSGNTVPADCKLSDFQKLIGDTNATLTEVSPLDEMLARIVGPHIRAIPDADVVAMQGAVDQALSAAMRLVLHHPEFQSVEAQWRSIDLIARSIETDDTLDVILYDISAEEIAADLAASDDLAQSGFARLLTEEPLDDEHGRGGYSALIGLYTFEETPPHAELLGRIARLAAHVDAPFFAAITPAFLDTAKKDRHPLVATAWDTLRGMPEVGHLGLVSPRFLLRRPYGAKSEPIYEFEFEEFTMADGLKGMLWANPVVLVAILLAKSFRENGASMSLGSIMSLGDMPFHYVDDRHGDQVALPCTERNLTLDKIEAAITRGIMSIAAIKGRDEIRLTSFGSLAGGEILGPWTGAPPPRPSPPDPTPTGAAASDTDSDADTEMVDSDDSSGDDMDLDDLLAGFGDDTDLSDDMDLGDDDTDADLAALLADL
jgi:pilus assembly protein FimV